MSLWTYIAAFLGSQLQGTGCGQGSKAMEVKHEKILLCKEQMKNTFLLHIFSLHAQFTDIAIEQNIPHQLYEEARFHIKFKME